MTANYFTSTQISTHHVVQRNYVQRLALKYSEIGKRGPLYVPALA